MSRQPTTLVLGWSRLLALLLFAVGSASSFGAAVTLNGPQIMIDGRRFLMKGVCYAPTPIGGVGSQPPHGDFFTATYRSIYDRDLPLMRQMGVNCLRVYGWSPTDDHTEFLDHAYNGGKQPIYVIINQWVDPGTDWTSSTAVDALKNDWRNIALAARNHPALLGYAIGNELNFPSGGNPAFWTAMNDIAGAVRNVDSAHLITTPLGDGNLLAQIQSVDAAMTNLNCWAVQMYRGANFSGFFPAYAAVSTRPLLVLEFGLDAFDATSGQEYANNAALSAAYIESLWTDIMAHTNVVSGGAVFCWSDEWWKSGSPADPSLHQPGGWNNPAFPDGRADEEWWGLYRISAGTPNLLEPRTAVGMLKNLWFVPPSPAVLSAVGFTSGGHFQAGVIGTPGYTYVLSSSDDLIAWTPRQTNFPPFTFIDTTAPTSPHRSYRAVQVP